MRSMAALAQGAALARDGSVMLEAKGCRCHMGAGLDIRRTFDSQNKAGYSSANTDRSGRPVYALYLSTRAQVVRLSREAAVQLPPSGCEALAAVGES